MTTDAIVIFDLDGTLFHTETVTVPAVREALIAHDVPPPADAMICSFIGKPNSIFRPWLRSLCAPDIAHDVERMMAAKELELIGKTGRLYPRIADSLETLRPCVAKMAICSNGSAEYIHAVLREHAIGEFFDVVRCRLEGDSGKSQMVGDLLANPDVRPAIRGVIVGDRRDDIEAARANGLRCIGAAYGYARDDELEGADALVAEPGQIVETVLSLLNSPE